MPSVFTVKVCLFIILLPLATCWIPQVINGRPRGGMLKAPEAPPGLLPTPENWFEFQKLDHFSGRDYRWWKQRYWMNDTFHKPGGPIFLLLGGEAEADPVWMIEGAWIQYAQMYNALDISTDSLQYLSSRQALADVANFISFFRLRYDLNDTHKLVTFGGSYSGSLAAWFRSKYPYMTVGAVASSAPLQAKVDFLEYFQVVKESMDTVTGPGCAAEIQNATITMLQWWGQEDKREKMKTMFRLCDRILWHGEKYEVEDLAGVFSNLAQNFAGAVQYYKDNTRKKHVEIEALCDIMTDTSRGTPIQRYADVNSFMLKMQSKTCLDFRYLKLIKELRQNGWNTTVAKEGDRQWLYQTCTEFGWCQSSDSYKQPFGDWFSFPWNYTGDQCRDIFGMQYYSYLYDNTEETNRYYGGLKLPASNIVLPNGSIDPWHAMSITNTTGTQADVIYIEGTAHGADMLPPSDQDAPQLRAAREKIAQIIGKWLS